MGSEGDRSDRNDLGGPSIARAYNYSLGGKDHLAADREVIDRGAQLVPESEGGAAHARGFALRAVRRLAKTTGVRQYLDLGCGLPTDRNVHDVVHEFVPDARVAYVDNDPVVLSHGRAFLSDSGTIVVKADIRDPQKVIDDPEIRRHLDFSQPIALLMFSVLHHVADDERPDEIAAAFRDAVCPGSFLALAHFHDPADQAPEVSRGVHEYERIFNETLGTGRWRVTADIQAYFGDFEMVGPGLVSIYDWYPDETVPQVSDDMRLVFSGGIGKKV
jgi:SAM-dependent methyltransferase